MGTTNGNMILLAREARGLSQHELADKIGMSKANIGKIENGDTTVKEQFLKLIADATNFPVSFFKQEQKVYPEHLIYRKRAKVSAGLLTPISAKVNIIRFHVQYLLSALNIPNPQLPIFEVTEKNTPQVIAHKVRKAWQIEKPVIDNTVKLLEKNGIAITSFNFGTERVDSRCVLTETKFPIIIYNKALLGDRQRFSLIYQLAHLIMHTATNVNWDRDIGHEANLFAAEFLMPEKEIRKDFENDITLPLLAQLKLKWKASMISLLYRADDLGYLTPNQKRYLLQQFNDQKIRRREPLELDMPVEQPALIRKWISDIKARQKLDVKGIASLLNLNTDEFIELYN
jgi:Zn-dependent peptidase ImmA (M78 family)/DNA-binding XRE family transcriptional regulator